LRDNLPDLTQFFLEGLIDVSVFAEFLAKSRAFMFDVCDCGVGLSAIDQFFNNQRDEFTRNRDVGAILMLQCSAGLEEVGIANQSGPR
jgi:hypothetical protein